MEGPHRDGHVGADPRLSADLRDAVRRVQRARNGALLVIGDTPAVRELVVDGVALDEHATPQLLAELAKMDGAVVVSDDQRRVVAANAHLRTPDGMDSPETGMRHRTADMVARRTGVPVVAVSEATGAAMLYPSRVELAGPAAPAPEAQRAAARLAAASAQLAAACDAHTPPLRALRAAERALEDLAAAARDDGRGLEGSGLR